MTFLGQHVVEVAKGVVLFEIHKKLWSCLKSTPSISGLGTGGGLLDLDLDAELTSSAELLVLSSSKKTTASWNCRSMVSFP